MLRKHSYVRLAAYFIVVGSRYNTCVCVKECTGIVQILDLKKIVIPSTCG